MYTVPPLFLLVHNKNKNNIYCILNSKKGGIYGDNTAYYMTLEKSRVFFVDIPFKRKKKIRHR